MIRKTALIVLVLAVCNPVRAEPEPAMPASPAREADGPPTPSDLPAIAAQPGPGASDTVAEPAQTPTQAPDQTSTETPAPTPAPAPTPTPTAPAVDAKPPAADQTDSLPLKTVMSVLGVEVRVGTDTEIGRIVDLLVDQNGTPEAAILDCGGFLGVGNRKVAIAWNTLRFTPSGKTDFVITTLTPDQIRSAEAYSDTKPAQVLSAPVATVNLYPPDTDPETETPGLLDDIGTIYPDLVDFTDDPFADDMSAEPAPDPATEP